MSRLGLKRKIIAHLKNIPDWRINRKIVVLESDDWGSLRMPSSENYKYLKSKNIGVSDAYDSIERIEDHRDLERLFDVLNSVKDKNGRSAVVTPFMNLANPDFEKIKKGDFQTYHWENFLDTIARYGDAVKTEKLYKQGMEEGLFCPEYHGKEHLNVIGWMHFLQGRNADALEGFNKQFYSIKLKDNQPRTAGFKYINGFRAAFYYNSEAELTVLRKSLIEGAHLFKSIFGKSPKVFDPTNSIFSPKLEETLREIGIDTIVVNRWRMEPDGQGNIVEKYYRFGQTNALNQLYYIRNCVLEPFAKDGRDEHMCMDFVNAAFTWKKPAIISTHRVNYLGEISEANRDRGLKSLHNLLKMIVKKHPDCEFMSSAEFSDLLRADVLN